MTIVGQCWVKSKAKVLEGWDFFKDSIVHNDCDHIVLN